MPFPDCDNRSNQNNRKNLVSTYNIAPVAHTKLLPGQELKGCCGPIKDECYTFSYQSNSNVADTGLFSTGRHCAQDFLTLTGKSAPPCFNPMSSASRSGGSAPASGTSSPTMCRLNLEVYQAINLLVLDWGVPKSSLQAILTAITSAPPDTAIPVNAVIHLNNIIGKDRQGRKLAAIISTLKIAHPNLRSFSFPKIGAVLSNANKTSNF